METVMFWLLFTVFAPLYRLPRRFSFVLTATSGKYDIRSNQKKNHSEEQQSTGKIEKKKRKEKETIDAKQYQYNCIWTISLRPKFRGFRIVDMGNKVALQKPEETQR